MTSNEIVGLITIGGTLLAVATLFWWSRHGPAERRDQALHVMPRAEAVDRGLYLPPK